MIIGMMPLQALAEATSNTETKVESVEPVVEDKDAIEIGEEVQPEAVGEGEGLIEVTFVKKDKTEVTVNFTDENAKLGLNGTPAKTGSWFFKSYFIGWSNNKDYAKDGEGFLLYETATVDDLLKVSNNEKEITLHAIYASASMSKIVKDGKVTINDDVVGKDFVNFDAEDLKKEDDTTTVSISEADLNDDAIKYEIKTLKSEFVINKFVQAAVYKNAWIGALENGSTWGDLSKKSGSYEENGEKKSFYGNVTVVDLHVHVDERLILPDEFELSFTSFTFRPYSVFSEINSDGNVVKPGETYPYIGVDNPGGKPKHGVLESIKDNKETTTFKVKSYLTNDAGEKVPVHDFVVRTRMRVGYDQYGKKIENATMEQIQSNMKLELASGTFEVPKAEAIKIAKGEAEPIKIRGYINGTVKGLSIGEVKSEDEVLTFKIVEDKPEPKPEPQPEPKPEPQPEYNPFWPIYFGSTKKAEEVKEKEIHKAYIFGYTDKTVKGNGNLTRAEAAAMVTRLANLDLSDKSKADYNDLQDGAWYLPNINAALKAGMIDATDNNLRPDDKITRGEFAKMLAAIDKDNDYVSSFSDIKGHKYEKEINKIDGNKRIEGYQDGTFKPDGFLTRAEAASFLNRMFNRVADDVAIEDLVNSIIPFKDLGKNDWFYFEIVEATNTHELYRRGGSDKFERAFEKWINVLN